MRPRAEELKRNKQAVAIVRALAAYHPGVYRGALFAPKCEFCKASLPHPNVPEAHAVDCVWRLAKEFGDD